MIPANCDRPIGRVTTSAIATRVTIASGHDIAPRSTVGIVARSSPQLRSRGSDRSHIVRSSAMPKRPCGRHRITRIIKTSGIASRYALEK